MEAAPLTLAHSHARTASRETQLSNHNAATREHELAAEQFAKAAQGTGDSLAFRTLKLLEDEHLKLARIIKVRSAQPHVTAVNEDDPTALATTSAAATAASSSLASPSKDRKARTLSPVSARRQTTRDLSSSIVSNLATARGKPVSQQRRGVPALPEVSTQNAGGRVYRQADGQQTSTAARPPQGRPRQTSTISTNAIPEEDASPQASTPSEEGFQRFFTTFENLFSKISPSLAFTSLPLSPGAISSPSDVRPSSSLKPVSPSRIRSRSGTSARAPAATEEPDLNELISKPALRALRDESGFPITQESFYVVPPSGGTVSYASMLQQRRGEDLGDGAERPSIPSPIIESDEAEGMTARTNKSQSNSVDADEFVDARESFGPPSPHSTRNSANLKKSGKRATLSRQGSGTGSGAVGSKKTPEELELENATLRQILNEHSKRLQMWEAQSQNQTAALRMAESFRAKDQGQHPLPLSAGSKESTLTSRRPPALAKEGSADMDAVVVGEDAAARLAALEAQLAAEAARREELEKAERKTRAENAKLQLVVGKYRERWEVLKQGARERQNKRAEGASTPVIPEEMEREAEQEDIGSESPAK